MKSIQEITDFLFNKTVKSKNPALDYNKKLEQQVNIEEQIIQNRIKLETLKSITEEDIANTFQGINLKELITSILQIKIAENVKRNAYSYVNEALDDIEHDIMLQRPIKQFVVNTIKKSFE